MDARLTHAQWTRMFQNFTPVADLTAHRLRGLLEHGVDPGELDLHSAVHLARARDAEGGAHPEAPPARASGDGAGDAAPPADSTPAAGGPLEI